MYLVRHEQNTTGRDFAVGDIHGHFTELLKALTKIRFDPAVDRLFSVGDMVDRGPECERVLEFLDLPWFHAVMGNHEDYVKRWRTVDTVNWMRNGGGWFQGLPSNERTEIEMRISSLPIAAEIKTASGTVGIVHADVPFSDWAMMKANLNLRDVRDDCMWSRGRVEAGNESGVRGIRAVVVGHQPMRRAAVLGNVYYIDTRGWLPHDGGYFTLLDLNTLEAYPPIQAKLEF